MNKAYLLLLLALLFSCKENRKQPEQDNKIESNTEQVIYDQSEGMDILDHMKKTYTFDPDASDPLFNGIHFPSFVEGIYFDKAQLVFQVRGDTTTIRQELESAGGSKNFRLELIKNDMYSQKQLIAIQDELSDRFCKLPESPVKRNVIGFGCRTNTIEIDLILNTPEKRKAFREQIMDSPAFRFNGPEVPPVNEETGCNDTLDIYLRADYPLYSTETPSIRFMLYNNSNKEVTCGEHYHITYEDEEGTWRTLPIHGLTIDIAYIVAPKTTIPFVASLYPDIHPNKAGRYRFFYEVYMNRKRQLMMEEFQLTDNGQLLKEVKKTPIPQEILQSASPEYAERLNVEWEEPFYTRIEEMPEFPGGREAMNDFIKKNTRYTKPTGEDKVEKHIFVQVMIEKDGTLRSPFISRGINPTLDQEALRIIQLMPKWQPGKHKGIPRRVRYIITVPFEVMQE